MITLYVCLLLLLLHVVLPGSDLRRLAQVRLRHTWLVWCALVSQVLLISVLPDAGRLSDVVHVATYGLAATFAVVNLRSAGTWVVAAGGALNLSAILANGGVMPASPAALAASGWQPAPGRFANSDIVEDPRLAFLGDVFATPSWLPVNSVYSVGDLLVVAGVALFLHQVCRPRGGRTGVLPASPVTSPSGGAAAGPSAHS